MDCRSAGYLRKSTGMDRLRERAQSAKRAQRVTRESSAQPQLLPPKMNKFLSEKGSTQMRVPRNIESVPTALSKRRNRNFIAENTIQVVMKTDDRGELAGRERRIDSVRGDSQEVIQAGLKPHFRRQETFGRVPAYITKYKHELLVEERDSLRERQTELDKFNRRLVSAVERKNLIQGLDKNWTTLQDEYQCLPVMADTVAKRRRRSALEQAMDKIQSFIVLLKNQLPILVDR